MKRLVLLALLATTGCASVPGALRIAADTGRLICTALGCGCTAVAGTRVSLGRRPIAFDVLPDGGIRPVYPEAAR